MLYPTRRVGSPVPSIPAVVSAGRSLAFTVTDFRLALRAFLIRFFSNDTFTRLATSNQVSVQ